MGTSKNSLLRPRSLSLSKRTADLVQFRRHFDKLNVRFRNEPIFRGTPEMIFDINVPAQAEALNTGLCQGSDDSPVLYVRKLVACGLNFCEAQI